MGRLHTRVSQAIQQTPLDPDFLQFVCRQEFVYMSIIGEHIAIPIEVMSALSDLCSALQQWRMRQDDTPLPPIQFERCPGSGRPKIILNMEYVQHLVENRLPIVTVAKVLGVSRKTLYRRLADHNLPVRRHQYSSCTDAELDQLVSQLKQWWPHSGTRIQRLSFVSCTDFKRNM